MFSQSGGWKRLSKPDETWMPKGNHKFDYKNYKTIKTSTEKWSYSSLKDLNDKLEGIHRSCPLLLLFLARQPLPQAAKGMSGRDGRGCDSQGRVHRRGSSHDTLASAHLFRGREAPEIPAGPSGSTAGALAKRSQSPRRGCSPLRSCGHTGNCNPRFSSCSFPELRREYFS